MAVPGWPLPTFSTASAASTRAVSTARQSIAVQPAAAEAAEATDRGLARFIVAFTSPLLLAAGISGA